MPRFLNFTQIGHRYNLTVTLAANETAIAIVPQIAELRELVVKLIGTGTVYATIADIRLFNGQISGETITDPLSASDWDIWTPGADNAASITQCTALKIVAGGSGCVIRGNL